MDDVTQSAEETPQRIGPPSWAEVKADPSFQTLTPAKQLVAFSRWHDDAFNHASQLPDWPAVKDTFNTKAAETQAGLQATAGVQNLDGAKVQVAKDTLSEHLGKLKAEAVLNGQPEPDVLTSAQTREALKTAGKDVWTAYFNQTPPEPTLGDKIMQPVGSFISEVQKGAGETVSALGYTGQKARDFIWSAPGLSAIKDSVFAGLAKIGIDPDTITAVKTYNPLEDFGQQLKKSAEENKYLDPRLQGSVGDIIGSAAGSLSEMIGETAVGGALLKGAGLAPKLAEKLAVSGVFGLKGGETGKEAAEAAGAPEDKVLASFLINAGVGAATAQVSPVSRWVKRLNEVTDGGFGRAVQRSVLEGGQNALQMFAQTLGSDASNKLILDQHPELLKDMQQTITEGGATGFVASLVFSALGGHGKVPTERPKPIEQIAPEAAPVIEKAKAAGAPQTAAAAEVIVREAAAAPAPETVPATAPAKAAPAASEKPAASDTGDVSLRIRTTATGETYDLATKPETSPEQLQAFAAEIDKSELPPETKANVKAQIDAALAEKAPAAPAAPALPDGVQVPEGVRYDGPLRGAPEGRGLHMFTETDPNSPAVGGTFSVPETELNSETIANRREVQRARFANPELAAKQAEFEARKAARNGAPAAEASQPVVLPPEERLAAPVEPLAPAPKSRPLPVEPAEPPSPAQVARAAAVRATPEEKAARLTAGEQQATDEALKSGHIPTQAEVTKATGRAGAKEAQARIEQAVRTAYPAETVPEGSRELTATKHEATGDVLPTVEQPKIDEATGDPAIDSRGKPILEIRPKFTNDADITAQQIDAGMRVTVPEDIFAAKKVNPAIHFGIDAATGEHVVRSVDSKYGEVAAPDDYTTAFREAAAFQKAQAPVHLPPEELAALNEAVNSELRRRGMSEDMIARFDIENPDTETVDLPSTRGKMGNPITVQENFTTAEKLGLLPGDRRPNPIGRSLRAISTDTRVDKETRALASLILRSGHDTAGISLRRVSDTIPSAGRYDGTNRRITLNMSAGHYGGLGTTIVHEVLHDMTLDNFNNPKTPEQQTAANNIRRIHAELLKAAFQESVGRAGNQRELREFSAAQRGVENEFSQYRDRRYYGVSSPSETITTVGTEASLRNIAKNLPALKTIETPASKTLWNQLVQMFKRLLGVKETSLYSQALDSVFNLATPVEGERAAATRAPPAESRAKTALDTRADLVEAALRIDPQLGTDLMSNDELQKYVSNTMEVPKESQLHESGWVGPDNQFIPAPDEDHYRAATGGIERAYPEVGAALDKLVEKKGRELNLNELYDFMDKHGFVRVVHGGSEIYASGKISPRQERILRDAAAQQQASLIHDLGTRTKTLYSPDEVFSAAIPHDPDAAGIETTVSKGGRVAHELRIEPHATRTDLVALQDALSRMKNLSDADRARMNQQLAEQLGPTVTLRAAKDKVAYGYDSVNNIANTHARQQANSVALDFGQVKAPTEAQKLDRAAAPFVVEAGGDRQELVRDLNQVSNSKDEKLRAEYTPILQHALDNFDRLNGVTKHYREVIKAQLSRERAAGINIGEIDNYVTRLLSQPDAAEKLMSGGNNATGGSRYFAKGRVFEKLADAIQAGYTPTSTDIVDLTQRRVESGERLVQQKALENELRTIKAPDGKPIIGDTEEYETYLGNKDQRVPAGYKMVQTGSKPLVIHEQLVPLFQALYGDSTINRFLKRGAGELKQKTLLLDTYHVGRIMFKELAYSKGAERVGYNKGLAVLEYTDPDLDRAVKSGDISQGMADYAREKLASGLSRQEITQKFLKSGLNVGKVSDNLLAEHTLAVPVIKNFNPWVFQKLSRGAMLQTAIENFERNLKRFPERGVDGNIRQTAKEYNEVFGNLQNQGLFKNKSYQDAVRVALLAPQWAESQLRAELRGYGQIAAAPVDAVRGNLRLGTVAQGQLTVILGMLAANQVVNYITTGHSTFENKDGHLLDAFIPGGKFGFWFSPLEIGAEYAHMASRYFSQHMTPMDALSQIARNKLGSVGRSLTTLFSGRDYAGRQLSTTGDRVTAALTDLIPVPIGLSGVIEKDPRQTLGFRLNRQPASGEKQLLQSAGLKVANAQSPASEIYALAYPFRADKSYSGPADYRDLRSAVENNDTQHVLDEINLLAKRGKTLDQIKASMGISSSGTIASQNFSGSADRERVFKSRLTLEQRELYKEAQAMHKQSAQQLKAVLQSLPPETKTLLKANKTPRLP